MLDTAAVGIPNLALVAPNIYRGGQPEDAGWNWLKKAGVDRVVKLNLEHEASDVAASALGMSICYSPIDLDDQILFRPHYETVQAAVECIQPHTFVHCEHGQDRTGLVVGCFRVWKNGWTKQTAWAEMQQHGFHEMLLGLTLFWEWAI